ncbi:putative ABC transporter ATP-binding protein YclH [Actinorhabdospora filicis]|uniref:ABC transporter ATP-binding protein YclH n=1 Tax=Actinorhabdospora filicis TaxID=1785913 RepID=A0A9W6SLN6_9ACTN|nr:ABC transporter ATP-binding protein [Actinorhabdospora filicis]GLZ78076.1 putative ABC transporter ATP-binding protein YclH [Actinorhabdospora filicis]
MTTPVLRLTDLVRTFPGGNKRRTVLKGVTCDFEEGRVYSVVGPSGSGKTTLLALAGGLDAPTSGTVSFRGRDVAEIGLGAYRNKHVATVFQQLNLLGYLTAVQNITAAMEITGVRGVSRRKRAHELLDLLGIDDTDRRRRPARLSGGQQQRVAIARALACDVDVLFADEPTGSLDQDTAAEIIEVFRRLAHEEGKCVVIVTHSPQVAAASDEVLHLKRGKLTRR